MSLPIELGERYVIEDIGEYSNLFEHREAFIGRVGKVRLIRSKIDAHFYLEGYHFVYIEVEDFPVPEAEWHYKLNINRREEYTCDNPVFQCAFMKLGPLSLEAEDLEYDAYDQEESEDASC